MRWKMRMNRQIQSNHHVSQSLDLLSNLFFNTIFTIRERRFSYNPKSCFKPSTEEISEGLFYPSDEISLKTTMFYDCTFEVKKWFLLLISFILLTPKITIPCCISGQSCSLNQLCWSPLLWHCHGFP